MSFPQGGKLLKVLLIEDDYTTAQVIRLYLETHRPNVILMTARSALEGVMLFGRENPDMVILDLGLPDVDGIEVLKQIRRSSDVPILIASVRDEPESLNLGMQKGADDYIVKPFDHNDFLIRFDKVSRRSRAK